MCEIIIHGWAKGSKNIMWVRYVPQIFTLGHVLKLKLEQLLLQVACFAAALDTIGAVNVIGTSGAVVGTVRVLVGSVSAQNKYFQFKVDVFNTVKQEV